MLANNLYQFKQFNNQTLIEFLSIPGNCFYVTNTWCGKPVGVSETVYMVKRLVPPSDLNSNLYVELKASYQDKMYNTKMYVGDMQNNPGKAIFDNREDAESFYNMSMIVFNNDVNWQQDHLQFMNMMRRFDNGI